MTHSLDWLVENRVLYSHVWGVHTLEDIRLSDEQMLAFLQQGTPPIHLIIDSRDVTQMPSQLVRMQNAMQATRSPAMGWIIFIGKPNPATRYLGEMVVKLFRLRYQRVESIEAAIKFLTSIDPGIPWDRLRQDVLPSQTNF